MEQPAYELYLPSLAMVELFIRKDYKLFQEATSKMLYLGEQFVFEDDVLKQHNKKTMKEIHEENSVRYVGAGKKERDGKQVNTWYDTWAEYYISQKDHLYGAFFSYKIRHLDLIHLDGFLEYQLEHHHNNDFKRFSRFLILTLRNYSKLLLEPEHIETAHEWINQKQEELKRDSSPEEKISKLKGRPQRTGDDRLTALNQEQTVLLIHILKESKIFFQGDYLTNKQAGHAFYILTGYSADTIRQKLSNTELELINNKKNLTDLDKIFDNIRILIAKEIKAKK